MDQIIRRILEAGMIEKWKKRTWYKMKEEDQKALKREGKEKIKFDIKPLVSAITLDDYQVRLGQILHCNSHLNNFPQCM